MRILLIILSSILVLCSCHRGHSEIKEIEVKKVLKSLITVPINGNSWYINNNSKNISANANYSTLEEDTLRTFFSIMQNCEVSIAIVVKSNEEEATFDAVFENVKRSIKVWSSVFDTITIGNFAIKNIGYNHLDLIKTSSTGEIQISDIILSGDFEKSKTNYVIDEFYWGKRGPSVHLHYSLNRNIDSIKWFYNEITVPKSNDVIGSFFMATGFSDGYFGIQVSSSKERRILFSVWSPAQTDNPNKVAQNQKIQLLKKGIDVSVGTFGSEGTGLQSYKRYNWKTDIIYKFLLKGEPTINHCTDYTAYFYSPEEDKWMLIASFRRPQTSTYLYHLHSFLENFNPIQGRYSRMGVFSNQWVCTKDGLWFEVNNAQFSADNTARKGSRLDYAGGVIDGQFFLKNCGFFNNNVTIGSNLIRPLSGQIPDINFQNLP